MLWNGEEWIDSEARERGRMEWAGYKTFGDPRSNSVGNFRTELVGGRSVWCEDWRKGLGPGGLSAMADGMQRVLAEGALLI
jgi:hypothetical protein